MVENLALAKANTIIVQVRRRADSYYLNSLEPPAQDATYAPGFDVLEYLIGKARPLGIEVHAWFNVGPMWPTTLAPPRDPRHIWHSHGPNASGDDMWMSIDSTGRLVSSSLDLGHPDAARYLADVILEPVKHYELDGIHLDYVRYPEDANYGWNPKAVERFQRLANRTGRPAANDPAWSEFRRRQVTGLVRQIYLRAYAIRPSTKVSAALITWGNGPLSDAEFRAKDAYSRVFQDWRGWMEEGILDLGIPMNYFAESRYAAWIDRWLEYEKDRQFGRAIMPGLGIYLNSIPDSIAQAGRVLRPSAAGASPIGINFYSFASTNTLNTAGLPITPNAEFYRAAGELFGESVPPPALPWKAKPERGHVYGWLAVDGGPGWLKDGATVWIEPDTGGRALKTSTDGGGFFGAVDLVPDRYRVRIERAGKQIYRTIAQDVRAGTAVRFDVNVKAEDFASAIPRIRGASQGVAAPGDLVSLSVANLSTEHAGAAAVPLPLELLGVQVVVNGTAAPLYSVTPERIDLQLPYESAESWNIMLRRDGLESAPFRLNAAVAAPVVLGVRRAGEYVEIYAKGLGLTDPPIAAGHGAPGEGPYHRVAQPVTVRVRAAGRDFTVEPLYAGLTPWIPGYYQVNARLPEGVTSGELRLQVGDAVSAAFLW